jgi:hypothetical protein
MTQKRKFQDLLKSYNNSPINQTNSSIDNDMIIDNLINSYNEYMDLDLVLPNLDNKCIVIKHYINTKSSSEYSPLSSNSTEMEVETASSNESSPLSSNSTEMEVETASSTEYDTLSSNRTEMEVETASSNESSPLASNVVDGTDMEIETESETCYTIKIYNDTIENYIDNQSKFDDKTILIPALNDKPTEDKSLSEKVFDKFLNKYISKFNNRSKEYKIEHFNLYEDVIHIYKNGNSNIYDHHLINNSSPRQSQLIFIPVKIHFVNNAHYNVLIIDKKKKMFTYYEPYGDYLDIHMGSRVNESLEKIKDYLLQKYPDYTYIDAHITNKDKDLGVQKRAEDFFHISEGYCVAWCLYLCYIRMFNCHLNTKFSISTILNKVFEEYTDLNLIAAIRIFITFVKREVSK